MRRVQVQKMRDSELSVEDMYLKWIVNTGEIEEMTDYEPTTDY